MNNNLNEILWNTDFLYTIKQKINENIFSQRIPIAT